MGDAVTLCEILLKTSLTYGRLLLLFFCRGFSNYKRRSDINIGKMKGKVNVELNGRINVIVLCHVGFLPITLWLVECVTRATLETKTECSVNEISRRRLYQKGNEEQGKREKHWAEEAHGKGRCVRMTDYLNGGLCKGAVDCPLNSTFERQLHA